jgi:group I intron endonuclease
VSPTNKIYIGLTRNFNKRLKYYKYLQCKKQLNLFKSLSKYGFDNHKLEIVHELPPDVDQIILNNYEIFYWEIYKYLGYEMMNLRYPGGAGGKHNDETIEKLKNSWTPERKIKQKEIMKNLGNNHPMKRPDIISNFIGENSPMFRKKGNLHPRFGKKFKGLSGNKNPMFGKKDEKSINSKSINQYDKNGGFIKTWHSITLASKTLNISQSNITLCCRGEKYKSAGGYIWKYNK